MVWFSRGWSGEAEAWAATCALLGRGALGEARAALREQGDATVLRGLARAAAGADAVEHACRAHERRVG